MKCGFCGREFPEEAGYQSCGTCPLAKLKGNSCGMVKCPYCGYENPKETGLVKKIRSLRRKA
ncbi:MAG: hypothetical protein H0Z38_03640 [Firmicutes bacterium]|nr:hypothetical protein [Bacillota bacterium]